MARRESTKHSSVSYTSIPIFDSPSQNESKSRRNRRISSYSSNLTFRQYLFSSRSLLAKLLFSFMPPVGPFSESPTDYPGTFISIFLLTVTLYYRAILKGVPTVFPFPVSLPIIYVLSFTGFTFTTSRLTKAKVSFRELFCLGGYGLFGGTLTLLSTKISERLFFPTLILFTGLSTLRITLTLFFRTKSPALRFVLVTPSAIIHTLFPVYLYYTTRILN